MIIKHIYLNLKDPEITPVIIRVPRYDSTLRSFRFHLMDGDVIYTIPNDVSITIRGTKPDRKGFSYTCSYTSSTGVVAVNCRQQMTAVTGDTICQLVIVDTNNKRLASFTFYLVVEHSSTEESTVYSNSDMAYARDVANRLGSVEAYSIELKRKLEYQSYEATSKTLKLVSTS